MPCRMHTVQHLPNLFTHRPCSGLRYLLTTLTNVLRNGLQLRATHPLHARAPRAQEVNRRLAAAAAANTTAAIVSSPWCGHLVSSGLQLTSHSRHRPMDLRVVRQQEQAQQQEQKQEQGQGCEQHQQAAAVGPDQAGGQQGLSGVAGADEEGSPSWLPACELRLKLGAVVAAEMRQAVKAEAGFRYVCGDSGCVTLRGCSFVSCDHMPSTAAATWCACSFCVGVWPASGRQSYVKRVGG